MHTEFVAFFKTTGCGFVSKFSEKRKVVSLIGDDAFETQLNMYHFGRKCKEQLAILTYKPTFLIFPSSGLGTKRC